jgi:undecaprenyl diphosphate synthase
VNYGGRAEIVDAVRDIAQQVADGEIDPERISEKTISKNLYDSNIPDVDLFIRSSGEQRTSNFLMWQSSYAEFHFDNTLWPDFDRRNLFKAVSEYAERDRRFGGAK